MRYLNAVDYAVILVYFTFLVGLGWYLKNMASQSLDDYFLGGRKLPWWALGISGMASFLDITGTMIIVSFLYMLGPRGLFIEFRGGAVLILPFMLLWLGKWHRRSGCMTSAEWMIFRFGNGFGGNFARIAQAFGSITLTVGMLAYLVRGIGLFMSMFLPFAPLTCSLIMLGVATVYTMASGFYGVVFTDMFQSLIIICAVIAISTMAVSRISDVHQLGELAKTVTGSHDWTSSALSWKTTMPQGYEAYRSLGMFAMFYLLRNIIGGMGYPGDPKYFGARNDRECGTLTFMWTWLMMFRWPMMMGFAVLGIFLVHDLFPDQAVLLQAADVIRDQIGMIDKNRWADVLASVINRPDAYPALVERLGSILGPDWSDKLHLLSYEGTINPERILPAVILYLIPIGFRGLILVALIAASMSTFDSTVNSTTAFFTRDIYESYLRPKASNRELIFISRVFSVVLVAMGFMLGYFAESINDIWGWIIMSLGAGLGVPQILRLYWGRFNGGGFATGMIVGIGASLVQRMVFPSLDERFQFILLTLISLSGCIVGTYLTKPTDTKVLKRFYRKTRPFGFWGSLPDILDENVCAAMKREHFFDLAAVPFFLLWQITLFMLPMQLIIKSWRAATLTGMVFAGCLFMIYLLWYKNLPAVPAKGK